MYRDLIFDYDGTIADSYPLFNEALQYALKLHGVSAPEEETMAALKQSVGYALKKYETVAPYQLLHDEMYSYYEPATVARSSLCPGARELLEAACEKGVRCYLYTHSGSSVCDRLRKMGAYDYFSDFMTSEEKFPRKPDPTALLALCARNEIAPASALMVGDRDIDVWVGHNAGMAGCLYDPDGFYDVKKVAAEHNVRHLSEIIALL